MGEEEVLKAMLAEKGTQALLPGQCLLLLSCGCGTQTFPVKAETIQTYFYSIGAPQRLGMLAVK